MENTVTQTELSELKDEIERFKENIIWKHILIYMQDMYMVAAEDALTADDIKQSKFAGGIAHAVRMVSKFDENIPLLKRAKESQ